MVLLSTHNISFSCKRGKLVFIYTLLSKSQITGQDNRALSSYFDKKSTGQKINKIMTLDKISTKTYQLDAKFNPQNHFIFL